MLNPLVSIITPTFGREAFLPLLYECIKQQNWTNLEWLVEDDSIEPSPFMRALQDCRVHYSHGSARKTIGQKRNALIARARGEYIVHFDDDDYYGPNYISHMISSMLSGAGDVCKLSGFFLFHRWLGTFAYWDLLVNTGLHFVWTDESIKAHSLSDADNLHLIDNHYGYGFSYVYKKSVWDRCGFPDTNWNEDGQFIRSAAENSTLVLLGDDSGLCLHMVRTPLNVFPSSCCLVLHWIDCCQAPRNISNC